MANRISKEFLTTTPQQRRDVLKKSQVDCSQADPETLAAFNKLIELSEEKAKQQPLPVVIDARTNVQPK